MEEEKRVQTTTSEPHAISREENQTSSPFITTQETPAAASSHGSANSLRSVQSPSLSPWHGQNEGPMVSSVISTLDLENHDAAHASQFASDGSAPDTRESQPYAEAAVPQGSPASRAETIESETERNSTPSTDQSARSSFSTPITPHDVLSSTTPPPQQPAHRQEARVTQGPTTEGDNPYTTANDMYQRPDFSIGQQSAGEDSALDALLEAHERSNGPLQRAPLVSRDSEASSNDASSSPSLGDASFGLDPDADTRHALQGTPFRPLFSSPLRTSYTERDLDEHNESGHNRQARSRSRLAEEDESVYDLPEAHGPSHTTAATGAPHTMHSNVPNTETVPTVSATGVPRILPRRASRSPSPVNSDEEPASQRRRCSRRNDDDEGDEINDSSDDESAKPPREARPSYAPSGSLTIALFSPGIPWRRRAFILLASVAINVGLPFINGVMLGFGEIFARSIVAPWIGLAPASVNINAPISTRDPHAPHTSARERNVGDVGLRAAMRRRNG